MNVSKIGSLTDFTSISETPILRIPAKYSLLEDLGLVKPVYENTNTFILTRLEYKQNKLTPVAWGTAAKNGHTNLKSYLPLSIPHYAETNAIVPQDIDGKWSWEQVTAQGSRIQTVQELYEQKMGQAKQAVVNARNGAFMQLLIDGTAAKDSNGGVVNYYTEMAITRKDVTFTLSDDTIDPMVKIYEAIDHIKDVYRGGSTPTRFMGVLERTLFDALERHPYTIDSYKYIAQVQSVAILNQGLNTNGLGLDTRYKTLDFGGITFVRVDSSEMTVGEGRVFPVDVEGLMEIHFAPAKDYFSTVNQPAQSVYYFEKTIPDRSIEMTIESNFLAVLKYPETVVRIVLA